MDKNNRTLTIGDIHFRQGRWMKGQQKAIRQAEQYRKVKLQFKRSSYTCIAATLALLSSLTMFLMARKPITRTLLLGLMGASSVTAIVFDCRLSNQQSRIKDLEEIEYLPLDADMLSEELQPMLETLESAGLHFDGAA